jgi:hypothetical protein
MDKPYSPTRLLLYSIVAASLVTLFAWASLNELQKGESWHWLAFGGFFVALPGGLITAFVAMMFAPGGGHNMDYFAWLIAPLNFGIYFGIFFSLLRRRNRRDDEASLERKRTDQSSGFSFARLGFWKLFALAIAALLIHDFLKPWWPGINGSRLGARPLPSVMFMTLEALLIVAALAAGIGTISDAFKSRRATAARLIPIGLGMAFLISQMVLVWM